MSLQQGHPSTASGLGRGIYAILYAFFDADGALDRDAMRRQTEACIASGAHGMAALGLATEVHKLTPAERLDVMRWLIEDTAGRVPVSITVYGNQPPEQIAFVEQAARLGVDWVILQPPRDRTVSEAELLSFFAEVMNASPLPCAIQNAPAFLPNSLSDSGLVRLAERCPNFTLLKGEGSALDIRAAIEATGDRLDVLNGRGGLELTDNFRAGCSGMIIAPELADVQVRIWEMLLSGDETGAEKVYADILPLVTFLMQSVEQFICYGKRLTAQRLELGPVHDRAPTQAPTDLGLDCLKRYAAGLEPYPRPMA
ncbi:dihydrodipicolinate synthase family protein [Minwuia sp.]|uniref:dihydrodipicolinate synthase family protein n=1 Tax=Minwuia sp. TaxID=2493630 RepID=UPI003A9092D6